LIHISIDLGVYVQVNRRQTYKKFLISKYEIFWVFFTGLFDDPISATANMVKAYDHLRENLVVIS